MSQSKILDVLLAATGLPAPTGKPIDAFLEDLAKRSSKLPDDKWNVLEDAAAGWVNDSIDAINAGKTVLPLPDWVEAAAEPTRRRRSADEPAGGAPTLKVGDEVDVTTERGTTITGKVTNLDDNGELVVDNPQNEYGFKLADITAGRVKVVAKNAPLLPAEPARRRRSGGDDGPTPPKEAGVGDTVELVNTRDKVFVGNVIELNADTIVLRLATNEELDFDRSRVKSLVVKVPATPAPAPAAGGRRARSGGDAAPAEGTRTRASNPGQVSVGQRIQELVVDNPGISEADVGKKLEAEGLKFAEASLSMQYKSTVKFLDFLEKRGRLTKR